MTDNRLLPNPHHHHLKSPFAVIMSDAGDHDSVAVLITQCIQNDFIRPIATGEPLPCKLHVGHKEAHRLDQGEPLCCFFDAPYCFVLFMPLLWYAVCRCRAVSCGGLSADVWRVV